MEKFNGVIRPLQKSDIPALKEILEYWLRDDGVVAYNEVDEDIAMLKNSLQKDSHREIFIAEINGKAIGMMGLSVPPKKELLPYAQTDTPSELIIAYIHPNHVRKGVGSALIQAVQNLAQRKKRKEILLESGPRHSHTGHPFYDKQSGFKRMGAIKDFYGKGMHTVVWQKTF